MENVGRDNMGQTITSGDREALKKLKKFILIEHNDIAPPLIYDKVGQTIVKGIEIIDNQRVYVVLIEILECDNSGEEISREEKILKYLFDKGRIKSLAGFQEEKRLQSWRRKRKAVYY